MRLFDAIDDIEATVSLAAIRNLPKVLRSANFKVTAVFVDQELIDVEAGDTTELRYGIAYDLGTTTVVATLLDLNTGTPVGTVKPFSLATEPSFSSTRKVSLMRPVPSCAGISDGSSAFLLMV